MQEYILSRGIRIVQDGRAAKFLIDPGSSRFLEPFLGNALSASEVANIVGVKVSSALYRVEQLLKLHLIELDHLKHRQGRPIKYFRAAADGFYVPFQATTVETLASLNILSVQRNEKWLRQSIGRGWQSITDLYGELGLRITVNTSGAVDKSLVPRSLLHNYSDLKDICLLPGAPKLWDQYCLFELTLDEAESLQNDLSRIYQRYSRAQNSTGSPYVVRLAMAPLCEG